MVYSAPASAVGDDHQQRAVGGHGDQVQGAHLQVALPRAEHQRGVMRQIADGRGALAVQAFDVAHPAGKGAARAFDLLVAQALGPQPGHVQKKGPRRSLSCSASSLRIVALDTPSPQVLLSVRLPTGVLLRI